MLRRWTVGFDEQLRMRCTISSEVIKPNGSIIRQIQHYGSETDVPTTDGASGDSTPKKLLEWFKVTTRKVLSHSQKK